MSFWRAMGTLLNDGKGSLSPSFTISNCSSRTASCKRKDEECCVTSSREVGKNQKIHGFMPRKRKRRMDARTYKALFRPLLKKSKDLDFNKHDEDVKKTLGEYILKDTQNIEDISNNQTMLSEKIYFSEIVGELGDQCSSAAVLAEQGSIFNVAEEPTSASLQTKCSDDRSPESNHKHDHISPKCANVSQKISLGVTVSNEIGNEWNGCSEFSERTSAVFKKCSDALKNLERSLRNRPAVTDIDPKAPTAELACFLPASSGDECDDSCSGCYKTTSLQCGEMSSSSKHKTGQVEPLCGKCSRKAAKSSFSHKQKEEISCHVNLSEECNKLNSSDSPLSMTAKKDVIMESIINTSSESEPEEGEIIESEVEVGKIREGGKNFRFYGRQSTQPDKGTSINVTPVNAHRDIDFSKNVSLSEQLFLIEDESSWRMKELLQEQMYELEEFKRFRKMENMKIEKAQELKSDISMDEFDQHFKLQRRKLVVMQITARNKEKQLKEQWLKDAFSGKLDKSFNAIPLSCSKFEVEGFIKAFCQDREHSLMQRRPLVEPSAPIRKNVTDGMTKCNTNNTTNESTKMKAYDSTYDGLDAASGTVFFDGIEEQMIATCGGGVIPLVKTHSILSCPSSSRNSSASPIEVPSVECQQFAFCDAVGRGQGLTPLVQTIASVQQRSNAPLQIGVGPFHLVDVASSIDQMNQLSDGLDSVFGSSSSDPAPASKSPDALLSSERQKSSVLDDIRAEQLLSSSVRYPGLQQSSTDAPIRRENPAASSGVDSSQILSLSQPTVTPAVLIASADSHNIDSVSDPMERRHMIISQPAANPLQSEDSTQSIEQERSPMHDGVGSEQVGDCLQSSNLTSSIKCQMVVTCDGKGGRQLLNSSSELVVPILQSIDDVMPLVGLEGQSIPDRDSQSGSLESECPSTGMFTANTGLSSLATVKNNQAPSRLLDTESELQSAEVVDLQAQFPNNSVTVSDSIEMQISSHEQGATNASCAEENSQVPSCVTCSNMDRHVSVAGADRYGIDSVSHSIERRQMTISQPSTNALQSADIVCFIEQEGHAMPGGLGNEQLLDPLQSRYVTTALDCQMAVTYDETGGRQPLNSSFEPVVPVLQSINDAGPLVGLEGQFIPSGGGQSSTIQAECPSTDMPITNTDLRRSFATAENNRGTYRFLNTESILQSAEISDLQAQYSIDTVTTSGPPVVQITRLEQSATNTPCIGENAQMPYSVVCSNIEVPPRIEFIIPEENMPASLTRVSQQDNHATANIGIARTANLQLPLLNFDQRFLITTPLPHGLHPEPLQNELFRICREEDLAAQICEKMKLQINSECQQEIEKIRKKYDILLQDVETDFVEKKKMLDTICKKVIMNKTLSADFRYMFSDNKSVEATAAPPGGVNGLQSSFMQLLLMQNLQRPLVSRPLTAIPAVIPDPLVTLVASVAPSHQHQSSISTPSSSSQTGHVAAVCHPSAFFPVNPGRHQYGSRLLPAANQIRSCNRAPAPHLNRYRLSPSISVACTPTQSDKIMNQQQAQVNHSHLSAISYADISRNSIGGMQHLEEVNSSQALGGLFSTVYLTPRRDNGD